MTLDQLKSLKVGQIVKYTNDVDALNVAYWKVRYVNDAMIEFIPHQSFGMSITIGFYELDIDLICAQLTIDQPLRDKVLEPKKQLERELRLVEAKIRDAEFDMTMANNNLRTILPIRFQNSLPKDIFDTVESFYKSNFESLILHENDLTHLRNQRNELIEKI